MYEHVEEAKNSLLTPTPIPSLLLDVRGGTLFEKLLGKLLRVFFFKLPQNRRPERSASGQALRLRATSSVSSGKSVRRAAQDDGFV